MKKRFLALMISVSMLAVIGTGCGEKETTTGDDVKVSVEESRESAPASVQKESVQESVQESAEEVLEESSVESSEEAIENTAQENENIENTKSETEDTAETVAEVVDTNGKDWSKAYDDYFQRENIMPEKVLCTATASADGVTFELIVAAADGAMWLGYDFGTAAFDMYATEDKVYAHYSMGGEEAWVWAPVTSEDEVSSMTDMADSTIIDTDTIYESTYREAMEDDGVIYDVLDASVDNEGTTSTAVYFINRETQMIEKCVMDEDGTSVVCLMEEIDSVEIPAAAANATEGTMEDVMGAMLGVLFMGASAGME